MAKKESSNSHILFWVLAIICLLMTIGFTNMLSVGTNLMLGAIFFALAGINAKL